MQNMVMTLNLTQVVLYVLAAIFAVVSTYVMGKLGSINISAKQLTVITTTAKIVVYAAEQIFKAGHGADKYAYAKARLLEELAGRGIYLDDAAIEAYIENAVLELKNNCMEYLESSEEI